MKFKIILLSCILLGAGFLAGEEAKKGRFNLAGDPIKPRFPVTEKVWPAKAGEASLCLWEDDKLAAYSINIDDNCCGDVPFWLEQTKSNNFKVTWFLIAETVNDPKAALGGTWELWKKVLAEGHEVESHSVSHWHNFGKDGTPPPGWKGFEWECTESIKMLEAGLPGHKIRFLAYPGGPGQKYNDPKIAGKYFLSARGGTGINSANQIDYTMIKYMSKANFGDPKTPWMDPETTLDPKNKSNYRGWSVVLFHYVGKPEGKEAAKIALEFYKKNEKDLWGGLYGNISLYCAERDTASLKTEESSADRIVLNLTDGMDDKLYAYPLTLKVRLPENWKAAEAEQDGKPVGVKLIENEKNNFVLVKAVPDRGKIILTPKK